MANEDANSTEQQQLGFMFFGTAIAFILHGVTCGQMIWFFRNQSGRSSISMIALVIFVWLVDSINCALTFVATLDMFLLPAVTYAAKQTSPCTDWVARAQAIPQIVSTMTVDGFFMMRVWRLSENKSLTMLLFIPYLASYAFACAQVARSFQLRCDPSASDLNLLLIYALYGFKIFFDGVVAGTMCYMLYRRSSGFMRHSNTIRIVRGLILWSVSTGVFVWIVNIFFLLSVAGLLPSGCLIFYTTGGVYVNAMLAQLNARAKFRAMANASIPLNSFSLGELSSSSQPVDQELLILPDPIANVMTHNVGETTTRLAT